ncbi:MAG: iron ABC transporter permease [Candidatus Methanomethylophilaceae archaeon]|nr:iron ABC transporter permease [Candidatus Methanomethylophilaceae archaeon]
MYYKSVSRKVIFAVVCVVIAFIALGLQLSFGYYDVGFVESYQILWDHICGNFPDTDIGLKKDHIIWDLRLPRSLAGMAVGAGLGVCGAAMQSTLKNPLADPYTTGISAGAGLGATISIVLGVCLIPGIVGQPSIVIDAFVFALIPSLVIIAFSSIRRKVTSSMMILIGIAVMYVFTAMTTFLKLTASEDSLQDVYMWSVGTLGKANWDNVWFMILATIFGMVLFIMLARRINVMITSDTSAVSLGVDPKRCRLLVLVIVSIVTAFLVSFTGTIGFVGLVAPHMVRIIIGSDNRYLIPASAAFGAMMLICSDVIARNIGTGLPVGVITACIGGPVFLYLLVRQRKSVW